MKARINRAVSSPRLHDSLKVFKRIALRDSAQSIVEPISSRASSWSITDCPNTYAYRDLGLKRVAVYGALSVRGKYWDALANAAAAWQLIVAVDTSEL